jgi:hypothetical protein
MVCAMVLTCKENRVRRLESLFRTRERADMVMDYLDKSANQVRVKFKVEFVINLQGNYSSNLQDEFLRFALLGRFLAA